MPQFMISVWHAPGTQQRSLGPYESEEDMLAAFQAVSEFNAWLQAEGAWVFACGLSAPEESSVVDMTDGSEPTVTPGPLAEASDHMGGLWVVEVTVLEQAHLLAARASAACGQRVEVRQLQG
jgi:hypothetical protein